MKIKCPRCKLEIQARLESYRDFVIYQCPGCKNNIAMMDNKVMVISAPLFKRLVDQGLFETCGNLSFKSPKKEKAQKNVQGISKDDILNLKILLETEPDFKKILDQL